ncbi:unnamed protein product [Schistocephalus solidus]|uniref:Uncharacterized protein n=1 Tax=Schistocephalus solidus TaxID=70667 RepID=A0A183T5Q4_SCHSO|nr:unnamed protein product [Schistocephalus solidus]
MPRGEESWVPMVSRASMACSSYEPDQYLLPPSAAEGHLDAPSVEEMPPTGLCLRPEARPAGRASDKVNPWCRRMDRSPPRNLQGEASPAATQATSSNELAHRLTNTSSCRRGRLHGEQMASTEGHGRVHRFGCPRPRKSSAPGLVRGRRNHLQSARREKPAAQSLC